MVRTLRNVSDAGKYWQQQEQQQQQQQGSLAPTREPATSEATVELSQWVRGASLCQRASWPARPVPVAAILPERERQHTRPSLPCNLHAAGLGSWWRGRTRPPRVYSARYLAKVREDQHAAKVVPLILRLCERDLFSFLVSVPEWGTIRRLPSTRWRSNGLSFVRSSIEL